MRRRFLRTRHVIRNKREELRKLRENSLSAGDKLTRRISEAVALGDVEALDTVKPYYVQLHAV